MIATPLSDGERCTSEERLLYGSVLALCLEPLNQSPAESWR